MFAGCDATARYPTLGRGANFLAPRDRGAAGNAFRATGTTLEHPRSPPWADQPALNHFVADSLVTQDRDGQPLRTRA
jgi:hypothetical protein